MSGFGTNYEHRFLDISEFQVFTKVNTEEEESDNLVPNRHNFHVFITATQEVSENSWLKKHQLINWC